MNKNFLEFSNVGNAYEDTGAVLAGGLYNSHQDLRNEGLTTAIKSGTIENTEWQNIGSANHIDNLRLVKKDKLNKRYFLDPVYFNSNNYLNK